MADDEFIWTFPCCMLLTERGNPEWVRIGEKHQAICVFTDQDLIEPFYKDKYGAQFAVRAIKVEVFPSPDSLADSLKDWEPQLASQNCQHIAIDVSVNNPPARRCGQ